MGNMTEKPTPPPENEPRDMSTEGDAVTQADIDMFNEWSEASDAARRTVSIDTPQAPKQPRAPRQAETRTKGELSPRVRRNRAIASGLAVTAGVGAFMYAAHEAVEEPTFSEETTTYTIQQGEGLFAAAQHVEGVRDLRDAVAHIQGDPANIDVLKDGLQPGEQLVIPVSVEGFEKNK